MSRFCILLFCLCASTSLFAWQGYKFKIISEYQTKNFISKPLPLYYADRDRPASITDTATVDHTTKTSQSINITSRHFVYVKNETNTKQYFAYQQSLTFLDQQLLHIVHVMLEPDGYFMDTTAAEMSVKVDAPGRYYFVAATDLQGIDNYHTEAHGKLRVLP